MILRSRLYLKYVSIILCLHYYAYTQQNIFKLCRYFQEIEVFQKNPILKIETFKCGYLKWFLCIFINHFKSFMHLFPRFSHGEWKRKIESIEMLRSPQSTLYQIKGIIIFTTGIGEKKHSYVTKQHTSTTHVHIYVYTRTPVINGWPT